MLVGWRQFGFSSVRFPVILFGVTLLIVLGGPATYVGAADGVTIRLALEGVSLEGTPVAWNSSQVLLLARNGYLLHFSPEEAREYRQVSPHFRPWSPSQMRGQLQREFGRGFEVSGTGNYLVVHPAGQKDRWAQRFEDLYRAFVHYFSVRGMRPTSPQFPLVAIVFHSQRAFLEYGRQIGGNISPGILGYYSPVTNRIILYDVTQGRASDKNWHVNAETIIHEATHQIAFNTGLHSRLAAPPRWVGEGLAMLFEAPGIWNPRHHPHLQDRVNRYRLQVFRRYASQRPRGFLPQFISQSDQEFARTPGISYAEAWALSFFLAEKEPAQYMKFLARTAAREPLVQYDRATQRAEFVDVFGQDLNMLEARYLRFLTQLP